MEAKHWVLPRMLKFPTALPMGPRPRPPDYQDLLDKAQARGTAEDPDRVFLDFLASFESELCGIYQVSEAKYGGRTGQRQLKQVSSLSTAGGAFPVACPESRSWRKVAIWFQELHHIKAKSNSWGSPETHALVKLILAGPGILRNNSDWLSWKPYSSSELLHCSETVLLAWQYEAGIWAEK